MEIETAQSMPNLMVEPVEFASEFLFGIDAQKCLLDPLPLPSLESLPVDAQYLLETTAVSDTTDAPLPSPPQPALVSMAIDKPHQCQEALPLEAANVVASYTDSANDAASEHAVTYDAVSPEESEGTSASTKTPEPAQFFDGSRRSARKAAMRINYLMLGERGNKSEANETKEKPTKKRPRAKSLPNDLSRPSKRTKTSKKKERPTPNKKTKEPRVRIEGERRSARLQQQELAMQARMKKAEIGAEGEEPNKQNAGTLQNGRRRSTSSSRSRSQSKSKSKSNSRKTKRKSEGDAQKNRRKKKVRRDEEYDENEEYEENEQNEEENEIQENEEGKETAQEEQNTITEEESAYEEMRRKKIEENAAFMRSLGLVDNPLLLFPPAPKPPVSSKPKKQHKIAEAVASGLVEARRTPRSIRRIDYASLEEGRLVLLSTGKENEEGEDTESRKDDKKDDDYVQEEEEDDEFGQSSSVLPPLSSWDGSQDSWHKFFTTTGQRRQRRPNTSSEDTAMLEKVYQANHRPSTEEREKLAEQLGWTPRSVQIWFQNRRAKHSKEMRRGARVRKS